ncbi:hypothetical protein, partial [Corynebacterium sanguinis]|uniref:hypothetical protein n=1 Tax=Corynebacterium sanguinis TaxID=2594913 RepID=UPI001C68E06A
QHQTVAFMVRLPLTERLRSRRVSYTYYRIVIKSPCPLSGVRAPPHLQIARLIRQRDWCSNSVHLAIAMIERAYCFVMEQVTVSLPFIAEGIWDN